MFLCSVLGVIAGALECPQSCAMERHVLVHASLLYRQRQCQVVCQVTIWAWCGLWAVSWFKQSGELAQAHHMVTPQSADCQRLVA